MGPAALPVLSCAAAAAAEAAWIAGDDRRALELMIRASATIAVQAGRWLRRPAQIGRAHV